MQQTCLAKGLWIHTRTHNTREFLKHHGGSSQLARLEKVVLDPPQRVGGPGGGGYCLPSW